jgi:hypothetical protein
LSASAHQSGARKTLRNPGPATSTLPTIGEWGKFVRIVSAICRGAFLAERARASAEFVA